MPKCGRPKLIPTQTEGVIARHARGAQQAGAPVEFRQIRAVGQDITNAVHTQNGSCANAFIVKIS